MTLPRRRARARSERGGNRARAMCSVYVLRRDKDIYVYMFNMRTRKRSSYFNAYALLKRLRFLYSKRTLHLLNCKSRMRARERAASSTTYSTS